MGKILMKVSDKILSTWLAQKAGHFLISQLFHSKSDGSAQ